LIILQNAIRTNHIIALFVDLDKFNKLELFYTDNPDGDILTLKGDEYRHCVKVKRHKVSDELTLIDGTGKIYKGIIQGIFKDEVIIKVIQVKEPALAPIKRILGIALTKNAERIEWCIEKVVEIGIDQIAIINTDRTERSRLKQDRLNKIVISAMKQSLNVKMPELSYYNSLKEFVVHFDSVPLKFMANGHENAPHLTELINLNSDILVLIGPEGDFTPQEISLAKNNGYSICSLGNSRLRTETAGVVAVTLINSQFK
jgi:16S rRNA (uracil1498-N3)-methyltransferase